ncbi:MAG: hypothetical protein Q8J69_08570 [Sphingobacteriaceae bacterium]|nr:hypothetical protein [Sphingobacteriaceae bacterium]
MINDNFCLKRVLCFLAFLVLPFCKPSPVISLEELAKLSQSNISKIEKTRLRHPERYSYTWPNGVSTRSIEEDISQILEMRNKTFRKVLSFDEITLNTGDTLVLYSKYTNSTKDEVMFYFGSALKCFLIKASFVSDEIVIIDNECQTLSDFAKSLPITEMASNSLNKLVMTEFIYSKNGTIQYDLRYFEIE